MRWQNRVDNSFWLNCSSTPSGHQPVGVLPAYADSLNALFSDIGRGPKLMSSFVLHRRNPLGSATKEPLEPCSEAAGTRGGRSFPSTCGQPSGCCWPSEAGEAGPHLRLGVGGAIAPRRNVPEQFTRAGENLLDPGLRASAEVENRRKMKVLYFISLKLALLYG